MAREKKDVVQFRWAVEGKEDPHAGYLKLTREDLPMADFSDDELANYAALHYNRSEQQEHEVMLGQLYDTTEHVPKIAFMTAIQQRVRWLSRQLAIAQGTYPVQPKVTLDSELLKGPIMGHYADGIIDLADSLGENRSAKKALITDGGVDTLSEALGKDRFGFRYRKAGLYWQQNAGHFYKAFGLAHWTLNMPKVTTVVRDVLPGVTITEVTKALTDPDSVVRWDAYVALVHRLLEEGNKYIPFTEDVINAEGMLVRSRFHASGRTVGGPTGTVGEAVCEEPPFDVDVKGVQVRGREPQLFNDVVVVGGGNSRGHLAQLRDYGYLSVEASVFPGVKKARDDSELTDDEKKNPHSYWFKEVNELHTKLGLNSLMVDHRQAESRIRRLAKDVDFHLVQDALGAGAKYIDRLIALRKVRKAVDKAIAESQQKVRNQFGDLGIEDPKPMTTLPSSLIPKDQDK